MNQGGMTRVVRGLAVSALLGGLALVSAEVASRIDDWWFSSIPLQATPDYNDLFFEDESGQRRGRPGAQYQQWRLNNFGFRAPTMSEQPSASASRMFVLGASESFGLYEPNGMEFPALLRATLAKEDIEVINGALPGMTVGTMRDYWSTWVSRFHPAVVLVYPSTHLYVDCEQWKPREEQAGRPGIGPAKLRHTFSINDFRVLGRLRSIVSTPDWIVQWRNSRSVVAAVAAHPSGWLYSAAPDACVRQFGADLLDLVVSIRNSGAIPIVATQAIRANLAISSAGERDLEAFRVFAPRAPAKVIDDFVTEANQAIRRIAESNQVAIIDLERRMRGKTELFEDLVHFNAAGAQRVADEMLPEVRSVLQGQGSAQ